MKDIQNLKQLANAITSLQKEISRLENDIKNLETELSTSGSTKTTTDLETDLENVKKELYAIFFIRCHHVFMIFQASLQQRTDNSDKRTKSPEPGPAEFQE